MSSSEPQPTAWSTAAPQRLALPLALLLVLLLSLGSGYQQLQTRIEDLLVRWGAVEERFEDVLVVDIDDASLRELQPQLGDWPYRRESYALLLDYLREAGARLVVFDIVFSGAREGDAAFARALAARPDFVLAAAALQQPVETDAEDTALLQRIAQPAHDGEPALHWAALTLPHAALLASNAAPAAVGIVTTRLDADGVLRRLPLLHCVQQHCLPALPLAARLRLQGQQNWQTDAQQRLVVAGQHWQLDSDGGIRLNLPASPEAIPQLSWQALMRAALGASEGSAQLQAQLRGRTVFIGSSAFFADAVMTPHGQLSGTALMAAAHAALGRGLQWQQPGPLWRALAWLIAALPLLLSLASVRPRLSRHALATLAALLASLGLVLLGLQRGVLLASLGPLLLLGLGLALTALAQLRWEQLNSRRLRYERELAEAASQAKSQFLANVSHEIRTPMNALLGTAELLSRTPLSAEQRRYVDLFQSSGQALFALINELLDISKIEAGRLELDASDFDVRALAEQCVALLKARAETQGLWLRLDFGREAEGWVHGDAKRLRQVLLNLLGNAIKFTQVGGVALLVRRNGDTLLLTVSDTGIGIAPSKHELVFEPFTQADGSVTRFFGGTGLGLSISRSLVELMGGRIWLESVPGQGASFHIALPLPSCAPPPQASSAPPPASAAELAALPPQTILLCEDNEVNVLVIEAMLEPQAHRIDVAGNGVLGVERFRQGRYDLVLMDVQMPGMDGLSATREIRRIEVEQGRPHTPVIALSANAFPEDVRRSLDAGCDDHLSKPVGMDELHATIARWGRHGAPPAVAPAAAPPPPPPLQPEALDAQRLAHARAFLAGWQQSWAIATPAQAQLMLDDLLALAGELHASELAAATSALYDSPPQGDAHQDARLRLEAEVARTLLALG
jgi:signal transduction histidine kinase/DNA-binding NarL/FixJ family response regulator